jgi:general stress protein YciG
MTNSNTRQQGQNLDQEARSKGGQNSPGNFKNDPKRAAELGEQSRGNNRQSGGQQQR